MAGYLVSWSHPGKVGILHVKNPTASVGCKPNVPAPNGVYGRFRDGHFVAHAESRGEELVSALEECPDAPPFLTHGESDTAKRCLRLLRLPGLIDIHAGPTVGSADASEDPKTYSSKDIVGDRRRTRVRIGPTAEERLSGVRLRCRGRYTREIERTVRGAMADAGKGGGKTSLNPARLWTEAIRNFGAKVTSVDRVELESGEFDHFLTLEYGREGFFVSLRAYTRLFTYACFRPRTKDLLPALRTRCAQTLKDAGHSMEVTAALVPGTVALAMHVLPWESRHFRSIAGENGERSRLDSEMFAAAAVPTTLEFTRRGWFSGRPKPTTVVADRWYHGALAYLPRFHLKAGRTLPATSG